MQVYRCCIDNILNFNKLMQGRLKEGKKTLSFFLDIRKYIMIRFGIMACGLSYGICMEGERKDVVCN